MRLALHTDYALRTLMFLAAREGRAAVPEVAAFFGISQEHLAKVARRLAQTGYIRAQRGAGGGLTLARPADQIRIGEVVTAFEGSLHLLDCIAVAGVCAIQPGCRLRGVLAEAERRMVDYLNSVRLSELVPRGGTLTPLLTAPAPAPRRRQPRAARGTT